MSISVIIHTLNSGKHIRQCLESVKRFDEIIICDMYSSDNTLSIAEEYGATIVMHEPGGGIPEPARPFAVRQANKEWVFVVDSDEVIPEALHDYLYQIISSENSPDAFFIPRKNYFMNRFMRSAFPDYQLRFFKKNAFKGWPETIHSCPEIEGNIRKVPKRKSLAIIHIEDNRIGTRISKINRYTDRELEKRKDKRASITGLLFQPFYRFIVAYLIKGGICDGKEGLIHAIMQACYKFVIIAKIMEKQKQQADQSGSGKLNDQ